MVGRVRLLRLAADVPEARWAAASTVLFALGGVVHLLHGPTLVFWALYLACYAAGGWDPLLEGLRALRERRLDVDLLMVVAAVAAASIGAVFDGALLIVIFATSGALEALATRRTEESIRSLLTLAPERATRLGADDAEEEVDAAVLLPGDRVLVRPGERIGADGTVVDGISEVDQAGVTGEPLPVRREPGEAVYAGTVNGSGALVVRVEVPAGESVVARIVALVEEASATKARTQLLIERVEQRYSVLVVVATVALLTLPLAFGAAFEPTLLRAMTFMIVASPCAIVLATMPPLLAAMANAGRHGVLVRSAVALERLARVDRVALDKTGTLTRGVPEVTTVVPLAGHDRDTVLRLAAAAEQPSEHPVGRAVVAAAGGPAPRCSEFRSLAGRGVEATVVTDGDPRRVVVGAPRLLDDAAAGADDARAVVATLEAEGRTVVVVLLDGGAAGVLALTDTARPEAAAAVAATRGLTAAPPVLLTGDNAVAARALAGEVGIDDVRAGLLPHEKVTEVRALQADGTRLAVVGDGVNDAPALAGAHVGVAMGRSGSDLAVESADVVLVRDDLTALPQAVALARRAERVVRANLVIAGSVIVALVTWDVVGTLPLVLGVAGHEGSTVVVALNGMRLLRERAWRDAQPDAVAPARSSRRTSELSSVTSASTR